MYLTEKGAPLYIYLYWGCRPKNHETFELSALICFVKINGLDIMKDGVFFTFFGDIGMPQDDNYVVTICIVFTNKKHVHWSFPLKSNSTQTSTFEEFFLFQTEIDCH